jgi:dihydropyrimidinase
MSTLIKNGTIVTAAEKFAADILVEGEKITLIGAGLADNAAVAGRAKETIDARGLLVIPGGIDVHTHLDMPFGGTVSADDFESGHVAALHGGTTAHVDFCIQAKGQTLAQALDGWHAKAEGKATMDYGFHLAITDLNDEILREIPRVAERGVTSMKLFMAYKGVLQIDDTTLFRVLQTTAESGQLVMVHAENGDAIFELQKQALARGETDPKYHEATRPAYLEGEATGRAIRLAAVAGAPIFIVHLTCEDALLEVKQARERGLLAFAETCTQYLFFTRDDLARPGFEGAKFVMSPPLRTPRDQEVLWGALARNELQSISTDHCPFNYAGQKELGRGDFTKIPNGCPGIEDRMMMVWDAGVRGGRLTESRFVEITATNPAKLFGLYPRKGTIAVGSDADIVLWDPNARRTLSAKTHHMRVDYNLYEGRTVTGAPKLVMLRGEVKVKDDAFVGAKRKGSYLSRAVERSWHTHLA